jgi:hypothetical protein
MAVEQIGKNTVGEPGAWLRVGHRDLETLAEADGYGVKDVLFDELHNGVDVTAAPIRVADIGRDATIDRMRVGVWGFRHSEREKETFTGIIHRSLGFASVLAAELESYDWRTQGAPTLKVPPLSYTYDGVRTQIRTEGNDYLSKREHLKFIVDFFLGEAITPDLVQQQGARALVGFGLQAMDVTLQERFIAEQTASLSRQIDGYGVLRDTSR